MNIAMFSNNSRCNASVPRSGPTCKIRPSDITISNSAVVHAVVPNNAVRAPEELFAIIPPNVARELVATSGPNMNPSGLRKPFN